MANTKKRALLVAAVHAAQAALLEHDLERHVQRTVREKVADMGVAALMTEAFLCAAGGDRFEANHLCFTAGIYESVIHDPASPVKSPPTTPAT
jgi:hypothetical protein